MDADLADMQLISNFNNTFRFLLCVIDIFSKCTWVVPLKDKKRCNYCKCITEYFKHSKRKPNKIWVDKGSEFYNINEIMANSTHKEGKSVAAERFIRTLKNKIYKHMISISKNVYIDK